MFSLSALRRRFHRASARPNGARSRPAPGRCFQRLTLEALEDRTLLSCPVSLTPDSSASHLVGSPVTWTAQAGSCESAPVYQFSVGPSGGPLHVVRDFSTQNTFTWDPLQQGTFDVKVAVKDGFTGTSTDTTVASYAVNTRVTGPNAVITALSNPLVALYSAPPSPPGTMYVQFAVASSSPSWQRTDALACVPGKSTNFLVAGLLPNTTYEMRSVLSDGTTSAPLTFTTGSLSSTLNFPDFIVRQPAGSGSDLSQGMVFYSIPDNNGVRAVATDLEGHIEWYYDPAQSGLTSGYPTTLVPGGTVLVVGSSPSESDVAREINLAGDVLRETNLDSIKAEMAARGYPAIAYQSLTGIDHDIQRLPNGDTAVIVSTRRTVNIKDTPTDYLGNDIIVLDPDFRVKWVWDAFDHLDVNRGPTLGDAGMDGAVDWLHANSVAWSPADGDLLLSMRAQDWVIKVDYRNGSGNGHVVWRLGQGGDFTINSSDPSPWFSHQHDVRYIGDTSSLTIFDDGNTRRASDSSAHSRGQVLTLNEQTMQATLVLNADLGNYSFAVGSAQKLPNGNYVFTSGIQQDSQGNNFGQTIEVHPDGTPAWVLEVSHNLVYRSYRVNGLYNGIYAQGQPPAAPSGLSASAVGSSQINLTWVRNSTDETGFQVLRSTDGVHFAQVGTAPAGATTFRDTNGLLPGTPYYYRVVASNALGESVPSNTAKVTTAGQNQSPPGTTGSLNWTASRGGPFGLGVLVQALASNAQPVGASLDLGLWGWLTAPGFFPLFQIVGLTRDAVGDEAVRLDFLGLWHVTLSFDPTGRFAGQVITFF